MNVNKRLNVNYRAGFRVNILDLLQELENKYRTNLSATVSAFETYDEISAETDNDKIVFIAELGVLHATGYINEDEYNEMIPIAAKIRMDILENLEKEGAENGNKEN